MGKGEKEKEREGTQEYTSECKPGVFISKNRKNLVSGKKSIS